MFDPVSTKATLSRDDWSTHKEECPTRMKPSNLPKVSLQQQQPPQATASLPGETARKPALDRARAAHHRQQQQQCRIASPLLRAAMCFEVTASRQFALIHYDAIAVRVRRPSHHESCRRGAVGDRPKQAACVCIGWRLCRRSRIHSAGTQVRPTAVSSGVPCQLARQRWSAISMAVLYLVTSASTRTALKAQAAVKPIVKKHTPLCLWRQGSRLLLTPSHTQQTED